MCFGSSGWGDEGCWFARLRCPGVNDDGGGFGGMRGGREWFCFCDSAAAVMRGGLLFDGTVLDRCCDIRQSLFG